MVGNVLSGGCEWPMRREWPIRRGGLEEWARGKKEPAVQ